MAPQQVVIRGRLHDDGTLELAEKPSLPPGPVEITVRPLTGDQAAGGDWWEYLQKARAELEAAGHPFRTKEEIDADLADLRSGDERIEEAYGEGTAE
jgi:hypothetical protein